MIVIFVLSVVVIIVVTQFASLGRDTSQLSEGAGQSVNTSTQVHGSVLCQVAEGTCAEECETYASTDHKGGCPGELYCCAIVKE